MSAIQMQQVPMQVTIPAGIAEGGTFAVGGPDWSSVMVTAPPGTKSGDTLQVMMPAPSASVVVKPNVARDQVSYAMNTNGTVSAYGGAIPEGDQARRSAERVARLEKKAAGTGSAALFAAIRIVGEDQPWTIGTPGAATRGKERVRELLQSGANANAWEPAPAWRIAGTLVMPFILCCAFGSSMHYSMQALHVAMMQGDTDVVKLLLDSGADPKAPAVFWNCCVCCSWRATSSSLQSQLMGNPDTGSANGELGDPVPWAQQAEIKRMVMERA
jgi:hypothetical protein